MNKLKIAYFGSPDFSAYFLEKLLKDDDIPAAVELVVTQQDKKVGRKQVVTPTSVKLVAEKYKIPVSTQSNSISESIDLALVFAFGEIIAADILKIPKYGFWNIHPSLLPKYRGASPVAQTLVNGEKETGVTLIKMDEEMDHGPIIAQEKLKIEPNERRPELTTRLTDLAYELFKNSIQNPMPPLKEQNHSKATYTKRLSKEEGFIPVNVILNLFQNLNKNQMLKKFQHDSDEKLFNLFRGFYPWPGLWTRVKIDGVEKRLKITDLELQGGKIIIKKVQLEGKNEVDFKTFNTAYKNLLQ